MVRNHPDAGKRGRDCQPLARQTSRSAVYLSLTPSLQRLKHLNDHLRTLRWMRIAGELPNGQLAFDNSTTKLTRVFRHRSLLRLLQTFPL